MVQSQLAKRFTFCIRFGISINRDTPRTLTLIGNSLWFPLPNVSIGFSYRELLLCLLPRQIHLPTGPFSGGKLWCGTRLDFITLNGSRHGEAFARMDITGRGQVWFPLRSNLISLLKYR